MSAHPQHPLIAAGLMHLGRGPDGKNAFDQAAIRLVADLDHIAKGARVTAACNLPERVAEAEAMVAAAGKVRAAIGHFLTAWIGEAEGWIGALSDREMEDFMRDPFEMLDVMIDRWEQFAAEHREREAAE